MFRLGWFESRFGSRIGRTVFRRFDDRGGRLRLRFWFDELRDNFSLGRRGCLANIEKRIVAARQKEEHGEREKNAKFVTGITRQSCCRLPLLPTHDVACLAAFCERGTLPEFRLRRCPWGVAGRLGGFRVGRHTGHSQCHPFDTGKIQCHL